MTVMINEEVGDLPLNRLMRDVAFQREMAFEVELLLHRNQLPQAFAMATRIHLRFPDIWRSLSALDGSVSVVTGQGNAAHGDLLALASMIRANLLRGALAIAESKWRECARAMATAEVATNVLSSNLESLLRAPQQKKPNGHTMTR